jgi:hypothetical protein
VTFAKAESVLKETCNLDADDEESQFELQMVDSGFSSQENNSINPSQYEYCR